jgi:hypothetical protein
MQEGNREVGSASQSANTGKTYSGIELAITYDSIAKSLL